MRSIVQVKGVVELPPFLAAEVTKRLSHHSYVSKDVLQKTVTVHVLY